MVLLLALACSTEGSDTSSVAADVEWWIWEYECDDENTRFTTTNTPNGLPLSAMQFRWVDYSVADPDQTARWYPEVLAAYNDGVGIDGSCEDYETHGRIVIAYQPT